MEEMTPKKKIRRREWERKLKDVNIRKDDVNKLVMNFLVTEGYAEAVEKFRIESFTELGTDLAMLTERMAIKKAVHSGNIEDAISKINDLNPEILDINPYLYFHLKQQMLIEMIRDGKDKEALEFAQAEIAPIINLQQSYLEELERTIVLLAFDNPKNSPYGDLMEMSQRVKTADEVNAAILISLDREKDPRLSYLLKKLLWSRRRLRETLRFPCINDDMSTIRWI